MFSMVAPTCPRPRFARRGQASRNSLTQSRRSASDLTFCADCEVRGVERQPEHRRARGGLAFDGAEGQRPSYRRSKRLAFERLSPCAQHAFGFERVADIG